MARAIVGDALAAFARARAVRGVDETVDEARDGRRRSGDRGVDDARTRGERERGRRRRGRGRGRRRVVRCGGVDVGGANVSTGGVQSLAECEPGEQLITSAVKRREE